MALARDERGTAPLENGAEERFMAQGFTENLVSAPSAVQPSAPLNPDLIQEQDQPPNSVNADSPTISSRAHNDGNSEWWAVILTSSKRGVEEFDVRVKEDTGTPVNWIHPNVLKRCKLDSQVEIGSPQIFQDMNGRKTTHERVVKVTWVGRRKTSFEEVFFVSSTRSPIEMVLGGKFVDENGRASNVCADKPQTQDARMYVAKRMTKEEKQKMEERREAHKKQSAEVIAHNYGKMGREGSSKQNRDSSKQTKDGTRNS